MCFFKKKVSNKKNCCVFFYIYKSLLGNKQILSVCVTRIFPYVWFKGNIQTFNKRRWNTCIFSVWFPKQTMKWGNWTCTWEISNIKTYYVLGLTCTCFTIQFPFSTAYLRKIRRYLINFADGRCNPEQLSKNREMSLIHDILKSSSKSQGEFQPIIA